MPGRPGVIWPEIGVLWGVSSRWTTELYASYVGTDWSGSRLDTLNWQNELLLTQGELPFDLALHARAMEHQARVGGGRGLEWGPVLQTDVGRTQLNANLFVERTWGAAEAASTELKYQWQVRHRYRPGLHFGAQGFGELGPWDHWSPVNRQSHRAGPAIFGTLPDRRRPAVDVPGELSLRPRLRPAGAHALGPRARFVLAGAAARGAGVPRIPRPRSGTTLQRHPHQEETAMKSRIGKGVARAAIFCIALMAASVAAAQAARQFSFAYDQPNTTAYGIAAKIFDAKLKELSGGKMSINQFPGAQLGQEPQMLQKMRAGDIDFVITSTANASTVAPQAGVFSLHFIFRDQAAPGQGARRPGDRAGIPRDGQGAGAGRAGARPADDGPAQHVQQAGSEVGRRHQGPEGARPGDQDRGHALPGLRRADRAHAVRRRLHVAADRRRQRRRERHQRLPRQQALRGRADPLDHRARGQQQLPLGQRQDLEQPDARAAALGPGGGRRGRQDRAGDGAASSRRTPPTSSRRWASRSSRTSTRAAS